MIKASPLISLDLRLIYRTPPYITGLEARKQVLADWFPQITCRRHEVYTTTLFTVVFQVHSITDLVQQLYIDRVPY